MNGKIYCLGKKEKGKEEWQLKNQKERKAKEKFIDKEGKKGMWGGGVRKKGRKGRKECEGVG